jgi:hypothetical protein
VEEVDSFLEPESFDPEVDESDEELAEVDSDELEEPFDSEDEEELDELDVFEPEPLRLSFL